MKRAVLIERCQLERAVLNGHYVSSRAEAKARGLLNYYTGRPCQRGHLAKRLVSNGYCFACKRLARRYNPIRTAFIGQRGHAKERGIRFSFHFRGVARLVADRQPLEPSRV